MENNNTLNIHQGLSRFLAITPKTKILTYKGTIDIILPLSITDIEDLRELESLGWEQLSDFSWRYWLNRKENNDFKYEEFQEYMEQYRRELDEIEPEFELYDTYSFSCEEDYYNAAYQLIEERLYEQ